MTLTEIIIKLLAIAAIFWAGWFFGSRNIAIYFSALLIVNGLMARGKQIIKANYTPYILNQAQEYMKKRK